MKTSITSALVLGTVLSLSGVALANTASPSTHRISAAEPAPSKEKHAKKDAKDKDKAPAKHDAKHGKDAKPGEAH